MKNPSNVPALLAKQSPSPALLDPLDAAYLEALTQQGFEQLLLRGDWKTACKDQVKYGTGGVWLGFSTKSAFPI